MSSIHTIWRIDLDASPIGAFRHGIVVHRKPHQYSLCGGIAHVLA